MPDEMVAHVRSSLPRSLSLMKETCLVPNRSAGLQGLVFGGLMAALVVVFALVPFLGLFLPIPLVLAYVRYGGRTAVMTAMVAALFSALFVGPLQTFFLLVPTGILPGLAFGYGFRRGMKPLLIGITAVAVFFVGSVADYLITRTLVLGGQDPIVAAVESTQGKEMIQYATDLFDRVFSNQPTATEAQRKSIAQNRAQIQEFRDNPAKVVWALLPSVMLIMGAVSTWINYLMCRFILPRFGHAVPAPTTFAEFRLPAWMSFSYIFVVGGSAFLGQTVVNAPWWVQLLWNILPLLLWTYILAGIAVAYGFLRKRDVPKPMAFLFSLVGFLLGGLGIQVYCMLMLWDAMFDFRGLGHGLLRRPKETP